MAILSSWGIEGNAAGKAFLIIVNAAKHRDFCRMAPSREPTPHLNSDRDIAAVMRPGWAAGGEVPLTSRRKRHDIPAPGRPAFTRRWPLGGQGAGRGDVPGGLPWRQLQGLSTSRRRGW